MMWWAMWCAAVLVRSATAAPASDSLAMPALDFSQIENSAPDDDGISYGVPPMSGRYDSSAPWLYLLAEMPRESQGVMERKRRGSTISVNPAVEHLLRTALSAHMERAAAHRNRNYLNCVGKRDPWSATDCYVN